VQEAFFEQSHVQIAGLVDPPIADGRISLLGMVDRLNDDAQIAVPFCRGPSGCAKYEHHPERRDASVCHILLPNEKEPRFVSGLSRVSGARMGAERKSPGSQLRGVEGLTMEAAGDPDSAGKCYFVGVNGSSKAGGRRGRTDR
jgi:hypothetical protein